MKQYADSVGAGVHSRETVVGQTMVPGKGKGKGGKQPVVIGNGKGGKGGYVAANGNGNGNGAYANGNGYASSSSASSGNGGRKSRGAANQYYQRQGLDLAGDTSPSRNTRGKGKY